jgi:hypothetical protein
VTRPDPGADNKARARLIWAELLNARDLRLAPALFAPEFVNHNARPCTPKGPDGVAEVFIRLWAAPPTCISAAGLGKGVRPPAAAFHFISSRDEMK